MLTTFTGLDSTLPLRVWAEKVEELARASRWSEYEKFFAAKRALRGPAEDWFASQRGITTWEALRDGLAKTFAKTIDPYRIHEELRKEAPKKDEPLVQYVHRLQRKGSQAAMDESVIIQYIVRGIPDRPRFKASLYACQTMDELLRALEVYEKVRRDDREDTSFKSGSSSKPSHRTSKPDRSKEESGTYKTSKCFNCGATGHRGSECPSKEAGPVCFSCHKNGHRARECPENKKRSDISSSKPINVIYGARLDRSRKDAVIGGVPVVALLDSGAHRNVLREDVWREIASKMTPKPDLERYEGTLNGFGGAVVRPRGRVTLGTKLDGAEYQLEYVVVPTCVVEEKVFIGDPLRDVARITLEKDRATVEPLVGHEYIMYLAEENEGMRQALEGVKEEYRDEVREIIASYDPREEERIPVEMKIILKDETPIYRNPRRLSPKETAEVEHQVEEWLREEIVRPSNSEFASCVVVARKKDGSPRVCIDFKPLNKVIVKERTPMPIIEDVLDDLVEARYFSTIDLKNGFFHVRVAEDSKKYTSFVTPRGQYEFNRMPFGLSTSPAVFTRYLMRVFEEPIKKKILNVFFDDGVVRGKTAEEALENFRSVVKVAERAGLQIKWRKCQIMQERIEFLGHVVEGGKVSPSPEKTAALRNYSAPRTLKQLQRFLGLASYFRKFIRGYAQIARPLNNLLRKDQPFRFGEEQERAFIGLKQALMEAPVLRLYHPDRETELHTDASKDGYGAILFQRCPDDQLMHPVYFMSRGTTPAESRYSSYELEFLAVVKALDKFRNYLLGLRFKLVTDCAAFRATMEKKELAPRVGRWVMLVEEFDCIIEHRSGTSMRHVDALSRCESINLIEDTINARLRRAQERDDKIAAIKRLLALGPYRDYSLRHGLVYKEDADQPKLVVPKGLQEDVIRRAHEVGHFGVRKTAELIKREYWMEKLDQKIEKFIDNCLHCILGARKAGKGEGKLNPIPKGDTPLHTLHADHVGPLPATKKKYKHLLVIVDAFSKYTWIFPTRSTGVKEVLKKFRLLQQHFGNPQRIITDRGTGFTAHEFEEYCRAEGIEHLTITAGVPRGNGQVERVNAIVTSVMSKIGADEPTKWYKYVSRVQRAINGTFQRSIGTSPFELMFGLRLRGPEDAELLQSIEREIAEIFQEERANLRLAARRRISEVQEENKRSYDRNRIEARQYKEGDLVAIRRTQQGPGLKLSIKFLGPYRIIRCDPHDRYVVEKVGIGEGPSETTTSADNMKPWRGFRDDLEENEDFEEADEEGNDENNNEDHLEL